MTIFQKCNTKCNTWIKKTRFYAGFKRISAGSSPVVSTFYKPPEFTGNAENPSKFRGFLVFMIWNPFQDMIHFCTVLDIYATRNATRNIDFLWRIWYGIYRWFIHRVSVMRRTWVEIIIFMGNLESTGLYAIVSAVRRMWVEMIIVWSSFVTPKTDWSRGFSLLHLFILELISHSPYWHPEPTTLPRFQPYIPSNTEPIADSPYGPF